MSSVAASRVAMDVRVSGLVQGVGFRPFVHRLAASHHLDGWVRNTSGTVEILVEGAPGELDGFLRELRGSAPTLARIDDLSAVAHAAGGCQGFRILPSADRAGERQPVSPDVATCWRCLEELGDSANRRYRHPFITCTDCGPRFTVIEAMPYDRERTSMRRFAQCPECLGEYEAPGDRRFHSETNSCPVCGPRLWFANPAGEPLTATSDEAFEAAAALLCRGGILALKGLGGFHLAADATDAGAVARLRERKHREAKPLAVMVADLAAARVLGRISAAEAAVLESPERPIVLVELPHDSPLARDIAPGLRQVGLMLAYTPLHHLLLGAAGVPLVMTSGNRSEEPIATANDDALTRLGGIADGFLFHDREIVARYDDSVVRVTTAGVQMVRRARGYAPLPLALPVPSPVPLVAVGPHLKNTFTLATGRDAWVSQHVGDLENLETLHHFREALRRHRELFRIEPEAVACDLHPGYLSTGEAEALGLGEPIRVQHHHAHIAAVLAEHGETGPAVGVAFDGTGYGPDDTVWGGEFLVADLTGFRRVGHLLPAPLPGGDLAARTPWRSALGYLSLNPRLAPVFERAFARVPAHEREIAEQQVVRRLNAPMASSMGRLFDAAAAVLGVRTVSAYEGQAAMELETLAGTHTAGEYDFPMEERPGAWVLDPLPLLSVLGHGARKGQAVADLAADFHASVARATALAATRAAHEAGLDLVVLAGGVFLNSRLLGSVTRRLERAGLRVLLSRRLGPNDAAISYGQAAVAAAQLAHRHAA